MRIAPITGTQPGVDHFWTCVDRQHLGGSPGQLRGASGPFPLATAVEHAWRVAQWRVEVDLSYDLSGAPPLTAYAGNGTYSMDPGMTRTVIYGTGAGNTASGEFDSELGYVCEIPEWSLVIINGDASVQTLGMHFFDTSPRIIVNEDTFTEFYWSTRLRFGDGVGSGLPFSTILDNENSSPLATLSNGMVIAGVNHDLFADGTDPVFSGSITVTPVGWWRYADALGMNPIWDAATGAQLLNPLAYRPTR